MSRAVNQIALDGWVLESPDWASSDLCAFILLQHVAHQTFGEAERDFQRGTLVEVVITKKLLAEYCFKTFKRGDRVCVRGSIQTTQAKHFGCYLNIALKLCAEKVNPRREPKSTPRQPRQSRKLRWEGIPLSGVLA